MSITYNTAELAKTKGFIVKQAKGLFNIKGNVVELWMDALNEGDKDFLGYLPTQSELQRWLREVHTLHITIDIGHDESLYWFNFYVYKIEKGYNYEPLVASDFGRDTYEEALEDGLKAALNLLK